MIKDSQKALNDQYLEDNKLLQLFKTRKDQLTKVLEELQKSKAPADKAEQALRQLDTRDAFDDVMPNGWTYASGLYCQGAPPDLSFENMTRMLNESKSYDKRWNETFPDGGKEDLYSQFKQNPNAGPKIPGSSTAGDDAPSSEGIVHFERNHSGRADEPTAVHERHRSRRLRLFHEVVSVGGFALQRDEHGTFSELARVGGNLRERPVGSLRGKVQGARDQMRG